MKATKHNSITGVMAFDDFSIRPGACPPLGNCDFEQRSVCSWSQDMSKDDFDWSVGSASGHVDGPSVDHTLNTTAGQ